MWIPPVGANKVQYRSAIIDPHQVWCGSRKIFILMSSTNIALRKQSWVHAAIASTGFVFCLHKTRQNGTFRRKMLSQGLEPSVRFVDTGQKAPSIELAMRAWKHGFLWGNRSRVAALFLAFLSRLRCLLEQFSIPNDVSPQATRLR